MNRCFQLYDSARNSLTIQFLCAALLAAGPALLGWANAAPADEDHPWPRGLAVEKKPVPGSVPLAEFFEDYPSVKWLCFFFPAVSIPGTFIVRKLDKKLRDYKNIDDEGLTQLLRLFNKAVGQKSEALGAKLHDFVLRNHVNIDDLNRRMFEGPSTQRDQINMLMEGLYTIFRYMTESDKCDIKITLALIRNKTVDDFICFLPQDAGPASSLEQLRHGNSGFSVCAREGNMLIVPETEKEYARLQQRSPRTRFVSAQPREGSLICYPVRHRRMQRVHFVISIFTEKSGVFKDAERKKYEFVISQFAKRILVEYNLLALQTIQRERQNNEHRGLTAGQNPATTRERPARHQSRS